MCRSSASALLYSVLFKFPHWIKRKINMRIANACLAKKTHILRNKNIFVFFKLTAHRKVVVNRINHNPITKK